MTTDEPKQLTREQFIEQLMKAGWRRDEAEQEWNDIQNEQESGL